MLASSPIIAWDGNYQIVYSGTFNVTGLILRIAFAGLVFDFNFPPGFTPGTAPAVASTYNPQTKTATITLTNFRNPLGASTDTPYNLLNNVALLPPDIIGNNHLKRLYVSVKCNAINNAPSSPVQATITFLCLDM
jgi:hypothetical protein